MTQRLSDPPVRLLAALFSPLAHDLRAGLNGISVWTHILERNADDTTARAVLGIRRALTQHSELAQEFSDFGRVLLAVSDAAPPPMDLRELLQEVAGEGAQAAAQRNAQIALTADRPGTPVQQPSVVKMLLLLLIRDALLAAPENARVELVQGMAGAEASVTVALASADRSAELLAWTGPTRRSARQALAALAASAAGARLDVLDAQRAVVYLAMPAASEETAV